jgi:hypothetical protein
MSGSMSGTPILWCCPVSCSYCSTCESCVFNLIFIMWPPVTFERRFCPIFPGITSPCTLKVSYVVVVIQQMRTDFAAVCLIIKSLVEMHQRVLYDGPRMLQTWLIVCRPHGWFNALSPYFHQPNLMIDNRMCKILPEPKYDYFWNVNIIQGLWSCLGIITKDFFSSLLQKLFSQG